MGCAPSQSKPIQIKVLEAGSNNNNNNKYVVAHYSPPSATMNKTSSDLSIGTFAHEADSTARHRRTVLFATIADKWKDFRYGKAEENLDNCEDTDERPRPLSPEQEAQMLMWLRDIESAHLEYVIEAVPDDGEDSNTEEVTLHWWVDAFDEEDRMYAEEIRQEVDRSGTGVLPFTRLKNRHQLRQLERKLRNKRPKNNHKNSEVLVLSVDSGTSSSSSSEYNGDDPNTHNEIDDEQSNETNSEDDSRNMG
eukprot:PhM_4_TR9198/c0_g1_i1/m.16049